MDNLLLFGLLILLIDIPFVKYFILPKYKKIGLALQPNVLFALCAYTVMICSWFLIKGDVLKGLLVGFVIYAVYAFTLATILPTYTLSFAMTEIIWGTILFGFVTYVVNLKNK